LRAPERGVKRAVVLKSILRPKVKNVRSRVPVKEVKRAVVLKSISLPKVKNVRSRVPVKVEGIHMADTADLRNN